MARKKAVKEKVAKVVKKTAPRDKPLTDLAKLGIVMNNAVKKGFKKYKPTEAWIERKYRGRNYYGIILTHEFAKAYFGAKYKSHLEKAVTADNVLSYFVDNA